LWHNSVDQEELILELLLEVSPGLNEEDASVHFLAKEVLGLLGSPSTLKESEGPEDFLLIAAKLLQSQAQIQHTGVKEGSTETLFTGEVWGRWEFWSYLLFRWSV